MFSRKQARLTAYDRTAFSFVYHCVFAILAISERVDLGMCMHADSKRPSVEVLRFLFILEFDPSRYTKTKRFLQPTKKEYTERYL